MMDLENFTVDELTGWTDTSESSGNPDWYPDPWEVAALARVALAAKRAEPVAWVVGDEEIADFKNGREVCVMRDCDDEQLDYLPLYTTPQLNSPEIPDGWINCSDQMPENSTDVTLFHPEIGVFNGYCWRGLIKDKEPVFFSNSGEHDDGPKQGVTHWMPLPTPPEKPL